MGLASWTHAPLCWRVLTQLYMLQSHLNFHVSGHPTGPKATTARWIGKNLAGAE